MPRTISKYTGSPQPHWGVVDPQPKVPSARPLDVGCPPDAFAAVLHPEPKETPYCGHKELSFT